MLSCVKIHPGSTCWWTAGILTTELVFFALRSARTWLFLSSGCGAMFVRSVLPFLTALETKASLNRWRCHNKQPERTVHMKKQKSAIHQQRMKRIFDGPFQTCSSILSRRWNVASAFHFPHHTLGFDAFWFAVATHLETCLVFSSVDFHYIDHH